MKKNVQLLVIFLAFAACKDEGFNPEDSFTKIYDSSHSDRQFDPVDIVANDSGYVIIAGQSLTDSDFAGVQIIHLDKAGNLVKTREMPDHVVPVGDLVTIDSSHYFVAMEPPPSLRAVLIGIHPASAEPEVFPLSGGLLYPLAASKTSNDNLLLLSYDPDEQQSVISEITLAGAIVNRRGYTIGPGSDIEASIYNHYTDPERAALPFFCGEITEGQVYFNGIYNYSLSLVFSDFSDTPSGVVQGQNLNGGISAATPLTESTFALMGFQFNDNFIRSTVALNTSGITSSVDLMASTISEFKARTPAETGFYALNETNYLVMAAETENRQVALYFFEATSGILKGIHKIGYLNPYTFSAFTTDDNNNLIVMGTTYVSGRFERIYVTKIPEKDISDLFR